MARTRQPPSDFHCPGCTRQVDSYDPACRVCGFEFTGQLVVTRKPEALDRVVEARQHISWDDLDERLTVRNATEHLGYRQLLTSLGFELRFVPESHRHQKALKAASATPEFKLAKLLEPLGEAFSSEELREFLYAQVRVLRPMPCHARTGASSSKLAPIRKRLASVWPEVRRAQLEDVLLKAAAGRDRRVESGWLSLVATRQ